MNDGEELFNAGDSWHNKEWGIDEKLKELSATEYNFNFVIIAVDSAKKGQGLFIDETKRYAEYFPKEAIDYFENGLKKRLYQRYINQENLQYIDFLIRDLIPFLEGKFMIKLDNKNLGIIGASMGGLSALNALLYTFNILAPKATPQGLACLTITQAVELNSFKQARAASESIILL